MPTEYIHINGTLRWVGGWKSDRGLQPVGVTSDRVGGGTYDIRYVNWKKVLKVEKCTVGTLLDGMYAQS